MGLNDPSLSGNAVQPLCRALCNGVEIPGCLSMTVTNNNYFQADHFEARFAMYEDPAYPNAIWDQQDTIIVDLQIGLRQTNGSVNWTSLIVGEVSQDDSDDTTGLIHVSGTDLSSRLIQTKTTQTYQNQTASEIATLFATQNGLTADVDPTTTPVGRYYESNYDAISPEGGFSKTTTQWDLLIELAKEEQYDLWVTGTTLHFKAAVAPSATPWVVKWGTVQRSATSPYAAILPGSNAIGLSRSRNRTLAKDVTVTVKSYDSDAGRYVQAVSGAVSARSSTSKTAAGQSNYVYNVAGKSEEQCLRLAQSLREQITRHERVIRWQEPGELALTPRTLISLTGAPGNWNQTYYLDSVTRQISFEEGFTQSMTAKNHSPQTITNGS